MPDLKKLFPIFEKNPSLHYLDSAATALKPAPVLLKLIEYYTEYSANIHRGLYSLSEKATEEYELVRKKAAEFIRAEFDSEIVFTSGTTQGVNMIARGWAENNLKEGDEIVVTEMEHHSNMVPWQELAKRKNLKLRFWEVDAETCKLENPANLFNHNTKLLAITHVSNVVGEVNPIKEIIAKAKEQAPEIAVVVDGAQAVPHIPVNVREMGADFYVFSGHKLYGPTGVGVLYAKASRLMQMDPVFFGGGMIRQVRIDGATWAPGPEKFEAGTPPIAQVIGLGAAIDFVNSIGFEEIMRVEKEVNEYALEQLSALPWIKLIKPDQGQRVGVISFVDSGGIASHDSADILSRDFNVCVRAGHHCTMPLHIKMKQETGTVRASLAMYNTKEDIDALISGLKEARKIFETIDNG